MQPGTDNLIGSGVVFNVEAFFNVGSSLQRLWPWAFRLTMLEQELAELESKGVPRVRERIHVSSRCHLNFSLYAVVDGLSEVEVSFLSLAPLRLPL